jgi:hypothetical protein
MAWPCSAHSALFTAALRSLLLRFFGPVFYFMRKQRDILGDAVDQDTDFGIELHKRDVEVSA